jgi:hypothetical protein
MEFITNPFVLAIVVGLLAAGITYVYLKKTYEDDEERYHDKSIYLKISGLVATCVLLSTGYLNYAYGQTEAAALTTEFFQVGQPQF